MSEQPLSESVSLLATLSEVSAPTSLVTLVDGRERRTPLSSELLEVMRQVAAHLEQGRQVQVVAVEQELSTQQAASLLRVSRPHVIELCERGVLPYRRVGTHRRLTLADVLSHREQELEARRAAADELAAEAQRLGLGY